MTLPPKLVLFVDDYLDGLEVWTLLLERSGYEVAPATTGDAALAQSVLRMPDVAVLDLQLPDISGLEVARRLRGEARTSALPLIALTGRGTPEDVAEARAAGFDVVLVKPCEPSILLAEIARVTERAALPPAS